MEARTPDIRVANAALYQLSYVPESSEVLRAACLVFPSCGPSELWETRARFPDMNTRPLAFSLAAALGIASLSAAVPARADGVLDTIVPLVDSIVGSTTSSPLGDLAAQLGSPTYGNTGSYAPIDTIPTYGNVVNYPIDPQFVMGEDGQNDGEQNDDNNDNVSYNGGSYNTGSYGNGSSTNGASTNGLYDDNSSQIDGGQNGDDQSGESGQNDD